MTENCAAWLRARHAGDPLPALTCHEGIEAWSVLTDARDVRPEHAFESVSTWCNATCRRGMQNHLRRHK